MQDRVDESLGQERLIANLAGALSLLGTVSTTMYRSFLFGVASTNAAVVSAAAAGIALLAVAAGYLPARRAGRIDPLAALRDD